ncbi:MAG: DUF5615 family PIN-like protein [Armatimonadetes bacterium]|nr:DUF5615 family PIN-like protein [Armatimonadota bacterium]
MRFLADMGISPITVNELRRAGHDAIHLREEGLQRYDDDLILEKARAEARILLTSDLDFGYLVAISGSVLPSVILFRLSDMRPTYVWPRLDQVVSLHEAELAEGAFVVISDASIRVRLLPIGEREA